MRSKRGAQFLCKRTAGGEDVVQRVMQHFMKILQKKHSKDMSKDMDAVQKLRHEAKRALNSTHQARVECEALTSVWTSRRHWLARSPAKSGMTSPEIRSGL